ncbi:hypothetical protein KAT24_01290 [Candidatus Pacearchaeota archaeon]|nr:hypothetical protein [Candidatus Pacearchaeota archaeon]
MRKIIIFALIMLLLPTFSADVISLNSGGSNVIVLNPDSYIEGFFGCVPTTCAKLGYNCDSWPDGCGKTLTCGTCGTGYTCTSGICVADAVPPVTPPGGNGAVTPTLRIAVTPTSININLAINTNKEQVINVKNLGTSSATVSISQSGLTNMVILGNTSLTLAAGETKQFSVIFVALDETGIFTGTINVGLVKIPVSLNIKTKLLLFDSNIVVLNRDYKVSQGSDLRTRVTLIPMGDPERLDVTLNYVIKDYSGKVYLTQSETVLVEKKVNFRRNFGTGSLPLGKYIVGLELVYSGGVAPSSAHFEIVQKTATDFLGSLMFILLIAILILAILIILLIIRRKKQQEQTGV